ncbi:Lysyl oxidase homolog 3A [Geodia barretti]|uniref:Lysyl oxidase homolog 3A n=1 Tax=Geodia barretti TaxID=519541 RepID=A0AA35SY34_GEOBA|nr:Lysyl oxidase homolog 3A [Geodia barretti]
MALQLLCLVTLAGFIIGVSAETCDGEGSLRLVGWLEADAGRLEVCHNREWGTICVNQSLDLWPHKNAEVACRDIGYAGALNSLFHHTIPSDKRVREDSDVPIHFSQVRCSGEQRSLLDCPLSEITEQCTHNQNAAIVCRRGRASGDVRLVGDQRDTVGAVELYHPMTGWTGICADANYIHMWRDNRRAAETVCAQLGYLGGTPYVQSLQRSAISDRKVVVGSCASGAIFDLTDCDISTIEDCRGDDLAWVQCSTTGRNGGASKVGSEREGVMQVQYSGRRGFICDNDWDNIDAQVACSEFDQYNRNADTTPKRDYTEFVSDLKPIWLGGIECTDKIVGESSRRDIVEVG